MAVLVVLIAAAVIVLVVVGVSGRAEKRPRLEGRSIYREPHSHVNVDGRPKVAYPTMEAAQRAAAAQGSRRGGPLRAYACRDPRCGAYHLGHG